MKITMSTGPQRKKPALGDTRTTKKYGLQVRIIETDGRGNWLKSRSGYYYAWRTPAQLVGTRFEYLLKLLEVTP